MVSSVSFFFFFFARKFRQNRDFTARETRRIVISWKVGNRVIVLRWSVPRVWENPHTRGVPSSYFSFALGSRSRERRFARPIYVYSSHGYSSVKSRSNHPIYGRIQMRVSFTNAHAVELPFPIKIRVSLIHFYFCILRAPKRFVIGKL